jgi:hypothetical protein
MALHGMGAGWLGQMLPARGWECQRVGVKVKAVRPSVYLPARLLIGGGLGVACGSIWDQMWVGPEVNSPPSNRFMQHNEVLTAEILG